MAYLTKHKFNISDLVPQTRVLRKILLVIGEENLREIYCRHLLREDYDVSWAVFGDIVALAQHLNSTDLLIIDFKDSQEDDKLEFLKIIASDFPKTLVVTVGHSLNGQILDKIMALGVVGHLDRKFSRPEDLTQLAKAAFFNNF